jgi:DNA-binding NarL/FixJ family response regulator
MDGMEALLNEAQNLKVLGKASSAEMALKLIKKYNPDLVLTDISMGETSGLELTKIISQQFPLVKVMVLSMHEDVHHIASLLQAGAAGYLLKNVKQEELFLAIAEVMQGRQYIQQSVAGKYARANHREKLSDKQSVLSPREIEILKLIAEEFSTAEISRQLFLSELTVETHRKNMLRKTGSKSVVGLLNYARKHGIL